MDDGISMTTNDESGEVDKRPGLTLTQVFNLDRSVSLYGRRISDLSPRGDLGLGLDPDGPVGFALVRAFRRGSCFKVLACPLVLSVFGDGCLPGPADRDAQLGDRLWRATASDCTLRLDLQRGSLTSLLACAARDSLNCSTTVGRGLLGPL